MGTQITFGQVLTDLGYSLPVDELELSNRTKNALYRDDTLFAGELVQKTEAQLLRIPNFGRLSLSEVKGALESRGLKLDTEILDRPEDNNAFRNALDENRDAALVQEKQRAAERAAEQEKQRAAGIVADVTSVAPVFKAVAEAIAINRSRAFEQAAVLLVDAANKIKPSGTVIPESLPDPFQSVAKTLDEALNGGFQDAAMLVRRLGERLPDPVFQKILAESFERHDQQRVAKPNAHKVG